MALATTSFIRLGKRIAYIKHKTNIGVLFTPTRDGSTDLYLIDSGNDERIARDIYELLQTVFGERIRIVAVLTTHSHADHCGGSGFFVTKTGAELWATAGEAALMSMPSLEGAILWGARALPELRSPYYVAPELHVDRVLAAGETVALFASDAGVSANVPPAIATGAALPAATSASLTARVYSLPGHYLDMAGFLIHDAETGERVYFLSDGISGRDVIKRYWIQYLFDERAFKQTLLHIPDVSADWYVPGHGEAARDAESLAELNLLAVLETERLILDILKAGALTTEELLQQVADRNDIPMQVQQFVLIGSTLRSYLASMYEEGVVTCRVSDNRLLWERVVTNDKINDTPVERREGV